jgi:capsular polysaccharide biosynthesis protein
MIKQLILLFFVFFLMAALAIAAIWTQMIPEYRAEAEIRVRPIIPHLVFQTEDNGMIPLYESFVNTQISIMTSTRVLQRVLDQREVQETQWYKKPPKSLMQQLQGKSPAPPVERLKNILSIQPRPKSEIIDVIFTDSSSKDAKIIVDAVLEQYILYVGETSDKSKDNLYAQLLEQSNKFGNEISGREKIITELRKSLGTSNPQELISGRMFRLDEAQTRLSDLRQTIAVLEWELKQTDNLNGNADNNVSNDAPEASIAEIEKKPKYHEDSEWRAMDINVRTIQHNLAASELDPNNPEIIRATKDMDFAKELLRLRETQLDEQWNDRPKNVPEVPITITNADDSGHK